MAGKSQTLKLTLVALLAVAPAAWADELILQGAPPQKVTFTGFDGSKLSYTTSGGSTSERELSRVSHIAVENEAPFNEAEVAFLKEERARSIDGYTKTLRSTNKTWLKAYAAQRLLAALEGSDRFDAKLVAYLAVLAGEAPKDPDAAEAAAANATKLKPALPDKGSKFLDTAVTDIESTLKQPNLGGQQQLALYNFLIEVHRQRGDESAETAVLERVEKLAGTLGDMPEIKAQIASVKVKQARTALSQKKYEEAARIINEHRSSIMVPREQSDALFTLAEAKRATASKSSPDAAKDVALMYMRVVAHFSEAEGKPNVLASMQAAAEVLEAAGAKADAAALAEQIVATFPDDPAAAKAKQDLARLRPAQ
ncbi:MAG TPA: hypothetical protein VF624_10325 [Tepidisphaeraceae bacterium]